MRGTIYRRLAVVTMIVSLLLVGCGKVQGVNQNNEPSNEIDELHSLEEAEPIKGEEDESLTQTDRNKLSHKISFMGLSQALIPTGCEAVSAVAILNHLGIEITPESFIEEFLPKQDFYYSRGKWYGPDPNECFVGSPFKDTSLGCFPNVIFKSVTAMKEAGYSGIEDIEAHNVTGTSLEILAEKYVSNDIPVLIWVTIGMIESEEGISYYFEDDTRYTWRSKEHCVVLCGYDEENYYVMDPSQDGKIVGYPKELVEKRYIEMNKMSLVICS